MTAPDPTLAAIEDVRIRHGLCSPAECDARAVLDRLKVAAVTKDAALEQIIGLMAANGLVPGDVDNAWNEMHFYGE